MFKSIKIFFLIAYDDAMKEFASSHGLSEPIRVSQMLSIMEKETEAESTDVSDVEATTNDASNVDSGSQTSSLNANGKRSRDESVADVDNSRRRVESASSLSQQPSTPQHHHHTTPQSSPYTQAQTPFNGYSYYQPSYVQPTTNAAYSFNSPFQPHHYYPQHQQHQQQQPPLHTPINTPQLSTQYMPQLTSPIQNDERAELVRQIHSIASPAAAATATATSAYQPITHSSQMTMPYFRSHSSLQQPTSLPANIAFPSVLTTIQDRKTRKSLLSFTPIYI